MFSLCTVVAPKSFVSRLPLYYTILTAICQGVLGKFFLVKMTKKSKQNCANCQALEIRVVPAPQTPARPVDLFMFLRHSLFILYHTFGHLSRGFSKIFQKSFPQALWKNLWKTLWISKPCGVQSQSMPYV